MSVHPPAPPATAFQWVVGPEMIDLDRWARVCVDVQRGRPTATGGDAPLHRRRPALFGCILLGIVVVLAVLVGPGPLLLAFVPVVALVGLLVVLQLGATSRLARQFRSVPALQEAFRFAAGPGGTSSESASARDQLRWSRYDRAEVHDDVLALVMVGGSVRCLPLAGLVGDASPSDVVSTIEAWMRSAPPEAPAGGGSDA